MVHFIIALLQDTKQTKFMNMGKAVETNEQIFKKSFY